MGEVLFYHLTETPLERTLPDLLERSLARGWWVVVRTGDPDRLQTLDDMLWTYKQDSFLAHGVAGGGHEKDQPVYLTAGSETPNGATVQMLVNGARIDSQAASEFDRTCLIFNGNEEEALTAARADWKAVKEAGLTGKYWAQQDGSWTQKATT